MTVVKSNLKALAEAVSGMGDLAHCCSAYEAGDFNEDWYVGSGSEDGDFCAVLTVATGSCDQPADAEKLARYYAAAHPAAVLALISENDLLREEVELDNKIIAERDRLLDAIPQCAAHGQCVPYAIQWVKDMQTQAAELIEERDQLKVELERLREDRDSLLEAGGHLL